MSYDVCGSRFINSVSKEEDSACLEHETEKIILENDIALMDSMAKPDSKDYCSQLNCCEQHRKSYIDSFFGRPSSFFQNFYCLNKEDFKLKLRQAKMRYEKYRIESFKSWPIPFIDVRELARNGLFFTGHQDVVECNFCQIRIHSWEADDNVAKEHEKWAPYCPFIRGLFTDNVTLKSKYQ